MKYRSVGRTGLKVSAIGLGGWTTFDDSVARMGHLRELWYREEPVGRVRRLRAVADALGVSRSELALAWLLHQPGVNTVITGATKTSQLRSNLKAIDLVLSEQVLSTVDGICPASAGART